MEKKLSTLSLILLFWTLIFAQKDDTKKYQYESKFGSFVGKLEVKFWSGGIIAYSLLVSNKSGNQVFQQDGFAISKAYDEYKKIGILYGEQIGPDINNTLPACSYFVQCECEKYLNIKIAKDYSLIKINCKDDVLRQIYGNEYDPEHNNQEIGLFYLKSTNK